MTARSRRSNAELRRLVEAAVNDTRNLARRGLRFAVDEVEASGLPPTRFRVWATLYFLPEGSPFCCGEPECHLGFLGDGLAAVEAHVRRAMRLKQRVSIDFGNRIGANYGDGVEALVLRRHALRTRSHLKP